MERDFWLERWRHGNTGWHQSEAHPFLVKHADVLLGAPAARERAPRVFVPLCGASLDMLWLRQQGADVVGIDLSDLAFRRFYDDADLTPQIDRTCLFERWSAGGIELLAGDFFDADASLLGPFDSVYDRAALFALPPEMRERYARRMADLCRPGTRILQITFEYDQSEMSGPPFAVLSDELERLYRDAFAIRQCEHLDVLAKNPGMITKGVTALFECAWSLERR